MTARRRFPVALAAAATAATLAACGDSQEDSAPAPAPQPPGAAKRAEPSKPRQSESFPARFERRVNTVCRRHGRSIKATLTADGGKKRRETLRRLVRTTEDLATDFERMTAPDRNTTAWKLYTRFYRDASDLLGRIETEVADEDKPAFDAYVAKSRALGAQERAINARYGFSDCAND